MTSDLSKAAKKALPSGAPPTLKKFLDSFLDSIPEEDRALIEPVSLVKAAQRHLGMSRARRPGEPKIIITTPRAAEAKNGVVRTMIDIATDDMPFLVDSVAAEITQNYKLIRVLLHPMITVARDGKGKFRDVAVKTGGSANAVVESHMHIELQGTLTAPAAKNLEKSLLRVLGDVRFATRDWQAMRAKMRDCQAALRRASGHKFPAADIDEYAGFLEYLHNDNFTLLGYREYKFVESGGALRSRTIKGAGLGLLHDDLKPVYISESEGGLPQDLQHLRRDLPPLYISKVNKRSSVHRPVPLDAVAVKQFDARGKVTGECLFIGLLTSVTYSRSIRDVPLLRRKTENVLRLSGFKPGSHDHKALNHVLEKYPRDELFQIDEKTLIKTCVSIMHLQERQRIALYARPDPFGRYISCLVYVPRDRYDTRLRMTIQKILEEEFSGTTGDFYTNLDDSPLARVMFMVYISQRAPPSYSVRKIEKRLQEAGRLWREKLGDELLKAMPSEERALSFLGKYAEAFPINYQENYLPKQAIFDIDKIEETLATRSLSLDLYRDKSCAPDQLRLKIFHETHPIPLSDVLPVLENMGLKVIAEMPFAVRPAGDDGRLIWIHDFLITAPRGSAEIAIESFKDKFEAALENIWYGVVENDNLNRLVIAAQMGWREIRILRAYVRYMRQMNFPIGTRYIEMALAGNPAISRDLAALFIACFDPQLKNRAPAIARIKSGIEAGLQKVASLDEDRILRSIAGLIDASLRTNYFQTLPDGSVKPWLSIKFESGKIKNLPRPVPYREIFVYAPDVEGVHLRGDVIARGGIRWSDRHEDFRTEILGLMKAQQVKNAVIVPMGAKGGFVVKKPPQEGGREAMQKAGIACYQTFIRGLLDITDNSQGKKIIKPKNVVCRDGDDPYLVVAADKGTATFSDIANRLSLEYGHWLGDAFASGGSAGYDHKKMGITARGAWESVKRHFRELNHDIQARDFDVVGVGDMAGDVFGNGMLLSKHIRLVGAFNHVHIFCDPEPDPAASLAERERLFRDVRGWDAYDLSKLSKGGRIFLRSEKSLTLTPEIRARFDIDAAAVTPAELIQAMLRARADLLWFGGIGTYVKATLESHADVGDKSNDSLRIDAAELRARVIGEGANLAVTQAARIEAAQRGIKLNADFIDNSGGVDSSDHEVNIKILTTDVMTSGAHKMTLAARDKLLAGMTAEVGALVLRNNYQQSQAISLMELQAAKNLPAHARFIRDLERRGITSRRIEGLPEEEEIERRQNAGKGLTRPELAILMSYAKILFAKDLLATDIPDLPVMQDYWLVDYFPTQLRGKYRTEILRHRLSREIVATTMATSLVNRMGPTFVRELMDKTGASSDAVARAYLIVRDAFDLRGLWDKIEGLDNKVPAHVQLRAMKSIAGVIERETLWMLTRREHSLDVEADIRNFGKGIAALRSQIDRIAPPALATEIRQRTEAAAGDGLPRELARAIAATPVMGAAFDIIRIASDCKADIGLAARTFFETGEFFHIDWLRRQAKYMTAQGRWSSEALEGLTQSLHISQAGLAAQIITDLGTKAAGLWGSKASATPSILPYWIEHYRPQARDIEPLLSEIRNSGATDLAMLAVAEQKLRQLYAK